MKVAIVGAGIIGLSSAYHLTEKFGDALSVTVIAERFSPDTTSDKAGGLILPVDFNPASHREDYDARIKQWTEVTFNHFHSLYKSEWAGEIDLCLLSGYHVHKKKVELPWWKDTVFDFRSISTSSPELQMLCLPREVQCVWAYSTYLVDSRRYLPWLMQEVVKRGGRLEKRKVLTLDELKHYDIIINCSGLGAVDLVVEQDMMPVRGQVVLVEAPWIKHFTIVNDDHNPEDLTYVLPCSRGVMLGGTAQRGNWSERIDLGTEKEIKSRCVALLPGLHRAEVIGGWAGCRPLRRAVRLEQESRSSKRPVIIHNYGHGGQGITLHWGCVLEVGKIVGNCIATIPGARL